MGKNPPIMRRAESDGGNSKDAHYGAAGLECVHEDRASTSAEGAELCKYTLSSIEDTSNRAEDCTLYYPIGIVYGLYDSKCTAPEEIRREPIIYSSETLPPVCTTPYSSTEQELLSEQLSNPQQTITRFVEGKSSGPARLSSTIQLSSVIPRARGNKHYMWMHRVRTHLSEDLRCSEYSSGARPGTLAPPVTEEHDRRSFSISRVGGLHALKSSNSDADSATCGGDNDLLDIKNDADSLSRLRAQGSLKTGLSQIKPLSVNLKSEVQTSHGRFNVKSKGSFHAVEDKYPINIDSLADMREIKLKKVGEREDYAQRSSNIRPFSNDRLSAPIYQNARYAHPNNPVVESHSEALIVQPLASDDPQLRTKASLPDEVILCDDCTPSRGQSVLSTSKNMGLSTNETCGVTSVQPDPCASVKEDLVKYREPHKVIAILNSSFCPAPLVKNSEVLIESDDYSATQEVQVPTESCEPNHSKSKPNNSGEHEATKRHYLHKNNDPVFDHKKPEYVKYACDDANSQCVNEVGKVEHGMGNEMDFTEVKDCDVDARDNLFKNVLPKKSARKSKSASRHGTSKESNNTHVDKNVSGGSSHGTTYEIAYPSQTFKSTQKTKKSWNAHVGKNTTGGGSYGGTYETASPSPSLKPAKEKSFKDQILLSQTGLTSKKDTADPIISPPKYQSPKAKAWKTCVKRSSSSLGALEDIGGPPLDENYIYNSLLMEKQQTHNDVQTCASSPSGLRTYKKITNTLVDIPISTSAQPSQVVTWKNARSAQKTNTLNYDDYPQIGSPAKSNAGFVNVAATPVKTFATMDACGPDASACPHIKTVVSEEVNLDPLYKTGPIRVPPENPLIEPLDNKDVVDDVGTWKFIGKSKIRSGLGHNPASSNKLSHATSPNPNMLITAETKQSSTSVQSDLDSKSVASRNSRAATCQPPKDAILSTATDPFLSIKSDQSDWIKVSSSTNGRSKHRKHVPYVSSKMCK